jgi:SagB-type dehydrogenase family enzyme
MVEEIKIGDVFYKKTKLHPDEVFDVSVQQISKPELYKKYPDKKKIKLDHKNLKINKTLDSVFHERKSVRKYKDEPITIEDLSYLLWSSTGLERKEKEYEFRTTPSAGATYPIETYIVVNNVKDLEPGVYHYNIKNHELEQLKLGDFKKDITRAAMNQSKCAYAGVVFIWTAVINRTKYRYGQRAYRYIFMDAGHIAENLALSCVGLGLGSCQIAALYDDMVNKIIELDGETESTIYMTSLGKPL